MKKSNPFNWAVQGLILACVLFLSSCSQKTKMEALLEQIPASSDFVIVGDFKQIIESAGGTVENSQIKLPDYLTDSEQEMTEELKKINSILGKMQIDLEMCAVTVDISKNLPVFLLQLKDPAAFVAAIDELGYTKVGEKGDASFFSMKAPEGTDNGSSIAVRGNYAYWMEDCRTDAQAELEHMIAEAKESPLSKTKAADYIQGSSTFGMIFQMPEDLKEEWAGRGLPAFAWDFYKTIGLKGDLQGNKLTVKCALFGEDGKQRKATDFGFDFNTKAKISKEALSYLCPDEFLVAASCLKDANWDKYFENLNNVAGLAPSDKAILAIMKSYMEKLDGTLAFGLGLENGMQSVYDMTQTPVGIEQIIATIVLETKEGMAQGIVNDLAAFLEQVKVPVEKKDNGITVTVPGPVKDFTFYAEIHDNILVVSNRAISKATDNYALKHVNFCDYLSASALALPKGDKLMTDLGFDCGLIISGQTTADPYESTLCIETPDAPNTYGLVGTIANTIVRIIKNKVIEQRWQECAEQTPYVSIYEDEEEIDPGMTFSE